MGPPFWLNVKLCRRRIIVIIVIRTAKLRENRTSVVLSPVQSAVRRRACWLPPPTAFTKNRARHRPIGYSAVTDTRHTVRRARPVLSRFDHRSTLVADNRVRIPFPILRRFFFFFLVVFTVVSNVARWRTTAVSVVAPCARPPANTTETWSPVTSVVDIRYLLSKPMWKNRGVFNFYHRYCFCLRCLINHTKSSRRNVSVL